MHGDKIWVRGWETGRPPRGGWPACAGFGDKGSVPRTDVTTDDVLYACGERLSGFFLPLPSLAQQFTFCSLFLFLKGTELVQFGGGGVLSRK